MSRRLTLEHVADAAIHCALAGLFVGLVVGALAMRALSEGARS